MFFLGFSLWSDGGDNLTRAWRHLFSSLYAYVTSPNKKYLVWGNGKCKNEAKKEQILYLQRWKSQRIKKFIG
jgi:hypothetical protein